ncbi:MAG TPA: hypothetical protein VFK68_11850 [Propionibacteriaceae bacterium]|nr:hypothetical protein [Propionibacteriaceae bacterium]
MARTVRGERPPSLGEIRAAFFRNLNLGQARSHSPTSSQLLDAFVQAGARSPSHVGTNGTVVYYHPAGPSLLRRVQALLVPLCGYRDMATVRSASALMTLERRLRDLDEGEVVLYDASTGFDLPTPIETDDGLVVVDLDHRRAITQHRPGTRPTSAGPFVASLVGVPVTVRSIATMRRVADRVRQYAATRPYPLGQGASRITP